MSDAELAEKCEKLIFDFDENGEKNWTRSVPPNVNDYDMLLCELVRRFRDLITKTEFRPNWNDAPDWAQFVAMDKGGSWWWYENEPKLRNGVWICESGDSHFFEKLLPDPLLESRPEKQPLL